MFILSEKRAANSGVLEARGGIEPPIEVLQTSALPLGDRAPREDGGARQETLARGEGRNLWSGRRGSNPRLRPWQGRTLPLSYSRLFSHSTALAYLLTIHCTRTCTRSSSGCSFLSMPLPIPEERFFLWRARIPEVFSCCAR